MICEINTLTVKLKTAYLKTYIIVIFKNLKAAFCAKTCHFLYCNEKKHTIFYPGIS